MSKHPLSREKWFICAVGTLHVTFVNILETTSFFFEGGGGGPVFAVLSFELKSSIYIGWGET